MNNARIASLLRRNVWWMDLTVIALVAYFAASICNAALAWNVGKLPDVDEAAPQRAAELPRQNLGRRVPLTQFAERNLLGLRRESLAPVPGVAQADQPVVDLTARTFKESDLQPCTVNAVIRGTMVADRPEWSMAVVVRNDTHEPAVLNAQEGHNAIFEDAIIVAIRSREVIVRRRDHFERCLGEGDAAPAPVAAATPQPEEAGAGSGEVTGVTRVSNTDYRVERAEVDRALSNLNEVATQARIVPSFKNGKANGFKMFSIKKGSIYDKIGLTNGDVIQKINGYDMNSPDRALEIYGKLRDATSLTIELTRGSSNMTLNYAIN